GAKAVADHGAPIASAGSDDRLLDDELTGDELLEDLGPVRAVGARLDGHERAAHVRGSLRGPEDDPRDPSLLRRLTVVHVLSWLLQLGSLLSIIARVSRFHQEGILENSGFCPHPMPPSPAHPDPHPIL